MTSIMTITFDPGGDAYTLLKGSLSSGYIGKGLKATTRIGYWDYGEIQVELPVLSTITRISLRLKAQVNAGGVVGTLKVWSGPNPNPGTTRISDQTVNETNGAWKLYETAPGVAWEGQKYVKFHIKDSKFLGAAMWIDQCTIEYDPEDPPNADFSYAPDEEESLKVDFSNLSDDGNAESTEFISGYLWDFGDGAVSSAENPSYTFSEPGTHTVTLTVTQVGGATDSVQKQVTVDPEYCLHDGPCSCESTGEHACFDGPTTGEPISLLLGEKRETATDLVVNTPAGPLAFTRSYRQGKLGDSNYQFMGLGWRHNHILSLNEDTGVTPNVIVVVNDKGGQARFQKTATDFYEAEAGSNAVIVVDTGSSSARYTLTTPGQTTLVFDDQGTLQSRSWPNGQSWSYDYYTSPHVAEGLLKEVDDGYGRKLQFSYIDDSGQFDHLQLWRVGDHDASGLESGSPSGRYVEFGYVTEKDDGSPVASPKALLATVRDLRGNTWSYDYYGQDGGESDDDLLNYLVGYSSPSVDTDGDGSADGSLTLKSLAYTLDSDDLAVNGDMEDDSDWTGISGSEPATNEQSTGQVYEGTYSRRVVASAADQGIEGESFDLFAGRTYAISARVYPVSGTVKMQVAGESAFDASSTGTGVWEQLSASYTPERPNEGLKLQFIASGGAAEFYVDAVVIAETGLDTITQERGIDGGNPALISTSYAFQPDGENQTTETTAGKETIHHFEGSLYTGSEDPAGNQPHSGSNARFRPSSQVDANGNRSQLAWSEDGKQLQQVEDALGHQTGFAYYNDDTLRRSLDAEGRASHYLYPNESSAQRQPSAILVSDRRELAVNGDMAKESDWSAISGAEPILNVQRLDTDEAQSGAYVRHVAAYAVDDGIEGASWDMKADRTYIMTARVLPIQGSVKMQASTGTDFDAISSADTEAWETLRAVYKPGSDLTGYKPQFVAASLTSGVCQFYLDSVSILEVEDLILNGDMAEDAFWQAVGTPTTCTQSSAQAAVGDNAWQVLAAAADDGVESAAMALVADRAYLAVARIYQVGGSGNVTMKFSGSSDLDSTDATGEWQTLSGIYLPASGGSQTLQFLADSGDEEFYVDAVQVFDSAGILRWQSFTYDANGRVTDEKLLDPADGTTALQHTTRSYYSSGNGEGLLETVTQEDLEGSDDVTTSHFYDSAGRVVQVNKNSTFGSCKKAYTVYDEAGNVLASICNYENAGAAPTTAAEAAALYDSQYPDQNQVTTHAYDEMGRRIQTTTMAGSGFAQTSWTFYDALNRVWRAIANYVAQGASAPGDWEWDDTDNRWEDGAGNPISHGAENNQNRIADTAYNDRGMVRLRRDLLGQVTLYGYDDADRLVKTVQNAATPDYNNDYSGASPDPDLSEYSESSASDDVDLISEQAYDAHGNLVQNIDPAGRVHFTVYDALNRAIKTVANAKDGATVALDPGDGGYDASNDPRSSSYAISTDPDRDQIAETEYDAMGRVIGNRRLQENRGASEEWSVTLYGYDLQGRPVKVIQQASDPDYDITSDPDLSDYSESGDPDQDIVAETVYNAEGQVLYSEDVNDTQAYQVYDGLGRQRLSIRNYLLQGSSDPADWLWDSGDTRWEDGSGNAIAFGDDNDQNLIAQTVYDADGRVQQTRDGVGNLGYRVYDSLGRQRLSIQNYVVQGASDPEDWEWDSNDERWEDGGGNAISFGSGNDENRIAETLYDDQGRVERTRDPRGNLRRMVYDQSGRPIRTIGSFVDNGEDPADWVWDNSDSRWEESDGTPIDHGTDNDQNIVAETVYDLAGRVLSTRDVTGVLTRFVYDALGRRVRSVANFVDNGEDPADWVWDATDARWEESDGTAIVHGTDNDQNLISDTVYDKAGQVVETRDARGTKSAFGYDDAGRRLTITQDQDGVLETVHYTCYDKAGRVLRTIQNWIDDGVSPDDQTDGAWNFVPAHNGLHNDQNRITEYEYDGASRRTKVIDPVGNESATAYFKDGQVKALTDPEGTITQYRYDGLRRRDLVVQGFVDNGEDPEDWVWDDVTDNRYEESDGAAIDHGSDNDANVIVMVAHDLQGRVTSMRDPRGKPTGYAYDKLGRRTGLTNPLSKTWSTAYADVGYGTQTTMTLPGINGGASYNVQRDFDRLGRLTGIDYDDSANTAEVSFGYDLAGNRVQMTENDGTDDIRITGYSFDAARRLNQVDFDTDGDQTVDETVSYQYDRGGRRTRMTLPGSLEIAYEYDAKGQLVGLTDWDAQATEFAYDNAGRHIATFRANGLRSRYKYDAASRLLQLLHDEEGRTLADFRYTVDGRGNRVLAQELLAHPATSNDTVYAYDDASILWSGTWTDDNPYKETEDSNAAMKLLFYGENPDGTSKVSFTFGTGVNHSLFDVYIGGSLWQTFDGYAASAGERTVYIPLFGEGLRLFEIRNRAQHSLAARNDGGYDDSTFIVRFKQLKVEDTEYDLHTVEYLYDALSRLQEARYNPGLNVASADGDLLRRYQFDYDLAGNRTGRTVHVNGSQDSDVSYSYNDANQLTSDGTNSYTYDNNGNLRSDGTNTYVWDRANRLLSVGNHSYVYDGNGARVQQTVSSIATDYLLDVQPGLVKVVAAANGANVERYLHGPRGIFGMEDNVGDWLWMVQDGLGSVRMQLDDSLDVDALGSFSPYGDPFGGQGSFDVPFGFTGEQTDDNGQVFLRARYYDPGLGVFPSLDPLETRNRYAYVSGNPANRVDPLGLTECIDDSWFGWGCRLGQVIEANGPGITSGVGIASEVITSIGTALALPLQILAMPFLLTGSQAQVPSTTTTIEEPLGVSPVFLNGVQGGEATYPMPNPWSGWGQGLENLGRELADWCNSSWCGGALSWGQRLARHWAIRWIRDLIRDRVRDRLDESEEDDCLEGRTPSAQAFEYAVYARQLWKTVTFFDTAKPKNAPIVIAATRVKDPVTNRCVDVVGVNSQTAAPVGSRRWTRWLTARTHLQFLIFPPNILVGADYIVSQPYVQGVQGHAETNLYTHVTGRMGQPLEFMGISQKPCTDFGDLPDSGCDYWLRSLPNDPDNPSSPEVVYFDKKPFDDLQRLGVEALEIGYYRNFH